MAIRTAKFNGRIYKIFVREPVDGTCAVYKLERAIDLFTPLNTQVGLITAIHEALHAENWAKSEGTIDRVSIEMGRYLWRLGYRISPRGEKK